MVHDPARTFAGCDYLGLSRNPDARAAAVAALRDHALSTTASRTTSGDTPPHRELEHELGDFMGKPAVLLPDGYTANIAACEALAALPDPPTALVDDRAHPSLLVAARAAGLPVRTFAHADPDDAARRRPLGPVAVLTDGVFTAHGALAPAAEFLADLDAGDHLLLDDCHAFGVLGPEGRGTADHLGLDDPRIIVTSTLKKALAAGGGFVAGPAEIVDLVRTRATAYICTTPAAPALIAAARANLAHLRAHAGDLLPRLHANAARLHAGLSGLGLVAPQPHAATTPIAAFDLGRRNDRVNVALCAAGFTLPLMSYPGGPSASYFRASVSAAHTPENIDALLETLGRSLTPAAAT